MAIAPSLLPLDPALAREAHGDQEGGAVKVRPARIEDALTVAELHDQGLLTRAATSEVPPRPTADRRGIFEHDADRFPILVAEGEFGEIVGWAALSEHSPRKRYRGIAECAVYVEAGHRGRGGGTTLLEAMIREARTLGYRKLMSRVLLTDEASRALYLNCGFREVGVLERHARQDGRWVDVVIVERLIPENQL